MDKRPGGLALLVVTGALLLGAPPDVVQAQSHEERSQLQDELSTSESGRKSSGTTDYEISSEDLELLENLELLESLELLMNMNMYEDLDHQRDETD